MKLRSQSFLYYGVYMIFIIAVIFTIDYSLIKNHLRHKAEKDLKLRCEKIHHTIQTSLNSTIASYLRGITKVNIDIVKAYYEKYKSGELTETEAKNYIQTYCNLQTVGTSGYIVAVEASGEQMILDIHPYKRHVDCSENEGCILWNQVRTGYAEYDWKNPEDNKYRKKVAYIMEFPEWNWILGATCYKSELTQLLNIDDFKNILSIEKIQGSGYAILYDSVKNVLYHPMLEKYQDDSFLQEQSDIIERLLSSPDRISFYDWKNPGEEKSRSKYIYLQKIPEYNFYLGLTGYMSEIYSPLKKIIYITVLLSVSAILLLLLSVVFYSRKVISPILRIIDGIKHYYADKGPFQIPETSVNEIQSLAQSFYNMTKEIDLQMEEKQLTIEQVQQMNKQLEIAKEKAEESDRLKLAFLANMSHEIRTPMNGILGFTDLLKNPKLSGEKKLQFIQIIESSGVRMLNTLNDIIDISKIEAGQIELVNTKVSINNILDELFVFFGKEADSAGLELIYKPTISNSQSQIISDKQKLESILINLIKNAIKYTKQGSVTFGCKLNKIDSEEVLEFYVTDTGIGIPLERTDAIFNRFEQSDIEDREVFEGSGLGLAISRSYAEMLGGSLSVTTKEGTGSTFRLTIPYRPFDRNESVGSALKSGKDRIEVSLDDLNLIVAEDDEVSKLLLSSFFENKFQNITYVSSGKEVIEAIRNNPSTDVILMDIKMPFINGFEATREIRKFNKEVIIIAQTAYGLAGDKEKAIEAGCDDYIVKPIKENDLIKMIFKHINH